MAEIIKTASLYDMQGSVNSCIRDLRTAELIERSDSNGQVILLR